jgi:hypothetical protein
MNTTTPVRFIIGVLLFSLAGGITPLTAAEPAANWTNPYNVVWKTPGTKGFDSMPIGGGNVALNVWAEKDALLFYIGSTDSWNAGPTLVKLGRVRVTLTPNPFGKDFRQELDLASNSVLVSGRCEDGSEVRLLVWVDANQPVVHVEGDASKPVTATVALEWWDDAQVRHDGNTVEWRHRNEAVSDYRGRVIKQASLEKIADLVGDPLSNRTFGGRISGAGLVPDGMGNGTQEGRPFHSISLKTSEPTKRLDVHLALRIAQDATLEQWQNEVTKLEAATRDTAAADYAKTVAWWAKFWDRSRIVINPDNKDPNNKPWLAGRNYQLFRAMLGADRNGQFPMLFNGGPFLCGQNPDERMWGGTYFMSQNQRLEYWPLIKSGDADMLRVGLDFYASHAKLQAARAKMFWGIDGAIFPELMNPLGVENYPDKDGHSVAAHLKEHYTTALEFAFMMLEYARYTGADIRPYLPVPEGIIHWFDQYYRAENKKRTGAELDPAGHLVLDPTCALEQFIEARNNTDAIAGLMAVTDGLLALPKEVLPAKSREFYQAFRKIIPPMPTQTSQGHLCLAPAEKWKWVANDDEFPPMYAVFPFGIYGLEKPDLELARDTWQYGYLKTRQKRNFCWYQSSIFTPRLGLTHEAAEYSVNKLLGIDSNNPKEAKRTRYPAFWDNNGYDETPDMDHGGGALVGLQEMLLQGVDRKILIFPAWPKDWDVDFKLHAPYQTTVEASLRNGKITKLVVTPASRRADVVDMSGVTPPPKPPKDRQVEDSLNFGKPETATASSNYAANYPPENAVDGRHETFWSTKGVTDEWLQIDLGEEKEVGTAMLQENFERIRIQEFALEVKQGDAWKELAHGGKIGAEVVLDFPPVHARLFRVRILKAADAPTILEFHLFPPR